MFNHIVTLNNMIAITILFEEKIFENAEEKTDGATFFTLPYSHTHTFIHHVHCFLKELLMSDD